MTAWLGLACAFLGLGCALDALAARRRLRRTVRALREAQADAAELTILLGANHATNYRLACMVFGRREVEAEIHRQRKESN